MLVLSRTQGQRIVIGEDIVVTVNKVDGNRVSVGIDAPREVRVLRGELADSDVQKPFDASQPRGAATMRAWSCR
ncbi:MAG: carbon storage regulator [Planctomycetia bacterium]|nr:carbon storage regulator [Planctomycetia bacterium]